MPAGSDAQRRVEKPWGYEVWWAQTDRYAGKLLIVEAGHKLSVQLHRTKDETSYLLAGRMRLWQGPSADELVERSQRFFHRRVVVLPVEFEEVDVVGAEALQRFVDGVE